MRLNLPVRGLRHGATPVTEPAPAKITLFLHVTGRRADGYHLLSSNVVFTDIGDRLALAPAPDGGLSLALDGPFGPALAAEPDNLVLRAARLLADRLGVVPEARMTLTKVLPVASGIGGGSADAAAALRGLNRLWGGGLPAATLAEMAQALGADVKVCLYSESAHMAGVGEVLNRGPAVAGIGVLLANPGAHVPTPTVFKARTGPFSQPDPLPVAPALDGGGLAAALATRRNDLQAPAMSLHPVIGDLVSAVAGLPGCRHAGMSGSGATCFGLFDDRGRADAARQALSAAWPAPGLWCQAGVLL